MENMVKRISRETSKLSGEFDVMTQQYDDAMTLNEKNGKKIKDQGKLVGFLEKEIKKRNSEYASMTRTFEEFLSARARTSQRDKSKRLARLHQVAISSVSEQANEQARLFDTTSVLRAVIPARGVC